VPTVALAASKGGVGKSTLCALLGSEMAGMGLHTAILCADPQHSTWKWAERSKAAGRLNKNLTVERVDNEDQLQERLGAGEKYDFILIDPQGALNQMLALSIIASELSIVPCRASYIDAVEAVSVFNYGANLKRANMRLVLNDVKGIDKTTGAFRDAVSAIIENKLPYFESVIQSRAVYAQFSKDAGSLAELATDPSKQEQVSKAKANIALLIKEIFTHTGTQYE